MNTKNRKLVLEGFQNRNDKLGSRKEALQSLTGQELMDYIQALADEITEANTNRNLLLN